VRVVASGIGSGERLCRANRSKVLKGAMASGVTSQIEAQVVGADGRRITQYGRCVYSCPDVDQWPTIWWNAGQHFAMLMVAQRDVD
jgi:hypothetical protein